MNGSAWIVNYAIEVTYPPNVTEEDCEKMLDELLDTVSKYGVGVDGFYTMEKVVE